MRQDANSFSNKRSDAHDVRNNSNSGRKGDDNQINSLAVRQEVSSNSNRISSDRSHDQERRE